MLSRSSIAVALALAALVAMPAQARHVRHHHHAHHLVCREVTGAGIVTRAGRCSYRYEHLPQRRARYSGCAGTIYDNDGRVRCAGGGSGIFPSPWKGRGRATKRAYVRHVSRANNAPAAPARGGLTRICEAGHCGTVVSWAADKFAGVFRDFLAMGYNIGSPGCYSPTGHMRHSLHHVGRACDLFNQVARNVTALRQPPPHVQIEVANHHGLTSGCIWRSPDCGHFDTSGIGGARTGGQRHHRARRARFARR